MTDLDAKMASSIRKTSGLLNRLPTAYHRLYEHLLDDPPAPASPAGQLGGRTGKPRSKPPAGVDLEARTAALRCVQAVGDAHETLAVWEWPHEPWYHEPLLNKPADDLSVPVLNPDRFYKPVQQLRVMFDGLGQTTTWTPADAGPVEQAAKHVRQAADAIKGVGLWERPKTLRECQVCYTPKVYADDRCEPCYRYVRRNGVERPWHLWAA